MKRARLAKRTAQFLDELLGQVSTLALLSVVESSCAPAGRALTFDVSHLFV